MLVDYFSPKDLIPPHSIPTGLTDALTRSMKNKGWVGRPLLGYRRGSKVQLVTGSHRWLAAKRARIRVPVMVMSEELIKGFKAWGFEKKYPLHFFYDNCWTCGDIHKIMNDVAEVRKLILADYRSSSRGRAR